MKGREKRTFFAFFLKGPGFNPESFSLFCFANRGQKRRASSLSLRRNEERPNVASNQTPQKKRRGRSCAQVLVYPSSAGKEE